MPEALDPQKDYPLAVHRPDLLKTPTGKSINDLTMDHVMAGDIAAADLRISAETLQLQAEIADSNNRPQLGSNFRRAAELTRIPDERVLQMYNALRPNASSKDELMAMADELEGTYSAPDTAALVREAAEVYERRDLLVASN